MKCPHCIDVTLLMTERQGVEIDYCPQCRGVWLDRGELDKLIEHSAAVASPPQPAYPRPTHRRDYGDSDHHHSGYAKRKHKSWLSEIFD